MKPVVVVVSGLRTGIGGVAGYFRCLERHLFQHVEYLPTGEPQAQRGLLATALLRIRDWIRVCSVIWQPDVRLVHVNPSLNARAVFRESLNVMAARLAKKKVLVFWHGWDWDFAAKLAGGPWALLFRMSYARADAHVVLASKFRDALRQRGCVGPIYCESTTVPDELFGSPPAPRPYGPTPLKLLFMSRIEKEKGIYVAIDAAAALRASGHPVSLVVAGDGSERKAAEDYVQKNRLDFVSFVGYVRGPKKQQALADADAYVFPSSHGEGMPLSVLEAMAAGLPVVCTRVAGLEDFFEDGRMGYSTESASVSSFVDKITQLLLDSERLADMSLYNQQFAKSRFCATVVAGRLRSIYGMLTGIGTHANAPKDWLKSDCRVIDRPGVD